jgi:2-polyprenyl-3-methyl-5-hydroxy-6-metoxy-1,4-benzoquinol methylase
MSGKKMDFDKAAASWDREPVRVKLADDVARAITNAVAPDSGMDVMDFGCGTGLLTLRLGPFVHSITGVDSSRGMLDVLNAKIQNEGLKNVKTQYVDLDGGDALEGGYHLIVSSMTLHHVKEIQPLLDAFFKVTAPSGHLCLADLDLEGGRFHGNNDGVFHFGFERPMLRKAFMDAGFEDIRDATAAEVMKPDAGGVMSRFTVFLMVGRKGNR